MSNPIIGAADPNKRISDKKDAEFVDIQAGIRYRQTRAPEGNTWNVVEKNVKTYMDATAGSTAKWGSITGNIADQTDLKTALNAKQNITISGYVIGTATPVDNGQTVTQALGNLQAQINAGLTGAGVAGQIAYFTADKNIASSANNVWDNITSTQNVTGTINVIGGYDYAAYSASRLGHTFFEMYEGDMYITDADDISAISLTAGDTPIVGITSLGKFVTMSIEGGSNAIIQANLDVQLKSNGTTLTLFQDGTVDLSAYAGVGTRILAVDSTGKLVIDGSTYLTSISGTANRISVAGTTINISTSYVGQNTITTLGTITTGAWQGTAITDGYISSAATWNAKPSGTLTSGRVPYAGASNTLFDTANFTWDNSTNTLGIIGKQTISGTITAVSAFARGLHITTSLIAAANNDTLSSLTLNPTFTNGSFTGVNNYAINSLSGRNRFVGVIRLGATDYVTSGSTMLSIASPSGGFILDARNHLGQQILTIDNIGTVQFTGAVGSETIGIGKNGSDTNAIYSTGGIKIYVPSGSITDLTVGFTTAYTVSSGGNKKMFVINQDVTISGGSKVITYAEITGVLNQTGGATGITYGFRINNTITAAYDYHALQIDNNSHYAIFQSGASAKNYFAGLTGIGIVPTSMLHVKAISANIAEFTTSGAITKFKITDTVWNINLGSDATGDLYYRNSSGNFVRLPIGTSGQTLKVSAGGIPEWV